MLKVALSENDLRVPTFTKLFPNANWYERETWEMFGIDIEGHPHLTRIMMPPTWEGHPLRKDYPARATEFDPFELTKAKQDLEMEALTFKPEEWGMKRGTENEDFMFLNLGPNHPSAHGAFRIVLQLDGEEIVDCVPDIGYHHRGAEKMGERQSWHSYIPYTDRIEYLGGCVNEMPYVLAVEKLAGITVPDRVNVIRVMLSELFRINSHLLYISTFIQDVGAMTPVFFAFTDRQKIYDLVTKRFLAVFYPAAEYQITTRITRIEGDAFKTEGKVLVNPGWLSVYGKEAASDDKDAKDGGSPQLVAVKQGETVSTEDITLKSLQTKPPARYNEATLLSAMEGAGKMVDDEELRAAMAERGLGTPATRAQTIEGLISEQYIHRDGRELVPSAKAFSLITLLKGLGVTALTSPELTGGWEYKLSRMERGELSREAFMQEIGDMAREVVERAKRYESDTVPGEFVTLQTPCPKCGGVVKENYKKFACQSCDWSTWKIVAGRQFEYSEIEALLREGKVGPLLGFRNKMGRLFNADVVLNEDKQPAFDFGQPKEGEEAEAVDFSAQESIGACPKCASRVFEHGMSYVCEKSVGPDKSCDFRSGKIILQQPIEREQMLKLLTEGRTDLLKGFVSARTRRKFSAFLVRGKDGKVGFEFEVKTPKAGAKANAKTAASKSAKDATEAAGANDDGVAAPKARKAPAKKRTATPKAS